MGDSYRPGESRRHTRSPSAVAPLAAPIAALMSMSAPSVGGAGPLAAAPPMDYREAYRRYEAMGALGGPGAPMATSMHSDWSPSRDKGSVDWERERDRAPWPRERDWDTDLDRERAWDEYERERRERAWERWEWERQRERDYDHRKRPRSPTPPRRGRSRSRSHDRLDSYAYSRDRFDDWDRERGRYEDRNRELERASDRDRYEPRPRYSDRRESDKDREHLTALPGSYGTPGSDFGRYAGPGGPNSLPSGSLSGMARAPSFDPMSSPNLLTFRAFASYMRPSLPSSVGNNDSASSGALTASYQAYRQRFQARQLWKFFEQRKEETWFKEKYGLGEAEKELRRRTKAAGRKGRKEAWKARMEQEGEVEKVNFDINGGAPPALSNRLGEPMELVATVGNDAGNDAADSSAVGTGGEGETGEGDDDGAHSTPSTPAHGGKGADESVKAQMDEGKERKGDAEADLLSVPADPWQILIKTIPPDLSRDKLEEVCRSFDGFRYLALGEPNSSKKFHRVGWAQYEPGTDMEAAVSKLDGSRIDNFTLHLGLSVRPTNARLRTTAEYANASSRLEKDIDQAKSIVEALEKEDREFLGDALEPVGAEVQESGLALIEAVARRHGVPERSADQSMKKEDLKKLLDLHIDYLRSVYHCCYYCVAVCDFPEELIRKCAKHVRKVPPEGTSVEEKRAGTGDETWARNIDDKVRLITERDQVDPTKYGGKSFDAELAKIAAPYIKQEDDEKHRCKECSKLFKGAQYVEKHIFNKHKDLLGDFPDVLAYFNNYALDSTRAPPSMAPTPTAQPPAMMANSMAAGAAGMMMGFPGMGSSGFFSAAFPMAPFTAANGGAAASMSPFGAPAASPLASRIGGAPLRLNDRIGGMMMPSTTPGGGGMAANGGSPAGMSMSMRSGLGPSSSSSAPPPPPMDPATVAAVTAQRPLDPRAKAQQRVSYQDLDSAAEGEVGELNY